MASPTEGVTKRTGKSNSKRIWGDKVPIPNGRYRPPVWAFRNASNQRGGELRQNYVSDYGGTKSTSGAVSMVRPHNKRDLKTKLNGLRTRGKKTLVRKTSAWGVS